ncbi:hypothetical protein ACFWMQ_21090 [Streptomyces sp. NPDC058372]|uniref:hypothetical protein n=1 Tax=Streptomyces sp. NPDC058372 TaxID=3346464 RepID=UPI00366435D1
MELRDRGAVGEDDGRQVCGFGPGEQAAGDAGVASPMFGDLLTGQDEGALVIACGHITAATQVVGKRSDRVEQRAEVVEGLQGDHERAALHVRGSPVGVPLGGPFLEFTAQRLGGLEYELCFGIVQICGDQWA